MDDLWNELRAKSHELDICIRELRNTGSKWAQAEHDYKTALYEEILKLKTQGMAATLISLVCYGIPKVAKLRLERDIASVVYKANQEAINVRKLQCRLIDNQIGREWSAPNAGNGNL